LRALHAKPRHVLIWRRIPGADMSALIAIPTFERESLLKHCLATAAELVLPAGSAVMVFDDASQSLDVERLMRAAGLPPLYHRGSQRLGTHGMTCHIWDNFLRGSHEHLLFLDSDMIANRSALSDGQQYLGDFDGLLTLYNSRMHPGRLAGEDRLIKHKVGNAGTLWTRKLSQLVLAELGSYSFANIDDAYSDLLAGRDIPIMSVNRSRLQHLGIVGLNNRYFGDLEHGLNFRADSARQMEAIVETYDDLMRQQGSYLRPSGG
jgi:hypothetical protein